ncbi:MAG: DUF1800 family protein [Candidatus Promineifilaceae bacterium]
MMPLSRRDFLRLGGLTAAAASVTSCSVVSRYAAQEELPDTLAVPTAVPTGSAPSTAPVDGFPTVTVNAIQRLLNRAGYGPRPGDLERAADMGFEAYLEEQLDPDSIEDTAADLIVRDLNYYHMDIDQLIGRDDNRDFMVELTTATVGRAVYSKRQLYEAMVEFWSDHFNIYIRKNAIMLPLKLVDDRDVIRPNALGKFRDLLFASAKSPAMLVYLDNVRNVKSDPNENYAREIMELHTLSVDAGYTQQDVQELARALTGWGSAIRGRQQGGFVFHADQHDNGSKQILDLTLPAGQGEEDVYQALEMLATHPSTARFISYKLVRHFVADEPPDTLVEQVAQTFLDTDGDIKSMLRVIFLSEEFATAPPKLKRPYSYLISAMRALNADISNYRGFIYWLESMGQLPFNWAAPNGYPDVSAAWIANLLPRWNFALTFLSTDTPGARVPLERLIGAGQVSDTADALDLFAGLIYGAPLGTADRALFTDYVGSDPLRNRETTLRLRDAIALMLASPPFQWM